MLAAEASTVFPLRKEPQPITKASIEFGKNSFIKPCFRSLNNRHNARNGSLFTLSFDGMEKLI